MSGVIQSPPEPTPEQAAARPREHLANERTLLAWVRTAITFEALGFGVSRFDIFLRQSETAAPSTHSTVAAVLAIVFVAAGLVAAAMGTRRYLESQRQIESSTFQAQSWPHLVLVAMLGLLGVGLIVYLAINS